MKPAKNSSGNRIYTNKDIKLILFIKKLLKEEKYTIEGAKKILKSYNARAEEIKEEGEMKVLDVNKTKAGELSLFGTSNHDAAGAEGDQKIVDDLREIRKFLEELYNQLD